ncbi:phosphatidylinositol-specific phospholipase C domain-containing protein [Enterobacter kobei]|uniref:phosphatidylinositol-specific phospholipase C domain-containing protein n=1 Tax=Enterobacter kobei TaxID=208224 RepID=UPI003A9874D2
MLKKLFIISSLLFSSGAMAHNDDGYSHDASNMDYSQTDWMAALSDSTPVWQLSIPGTHDSGSRYGGDSVANQVMTIEEQLRAGIRYLDVRVRHIDNAFAIHHSFVYQHLNFDDVMKQATQFLRSHPQEFIFMRVRDEYKGANNTRTAQETFGEYVTRYRQWISTAYFSRNIDMLPIEQLRGKIYFIYDNVIPFTSFHINGAQLSNLPVQDAYSVKTNWDLYSKWTKVKDFLNTNKDMQRLSINHLSASGGSFPYFIASGHSSHGTKAPRLATGLTTPGWKHRYPDFPRVSCFIGICTIAFEGTNTLTKNYLNTNTLNRTGIIAADFPGKGLIKAIINKNSFPGKRYTISATQQCMSVDGGDPGKSGARVIVEDCKSNPHAQLFVYEDNQLKIGQQCVDVNQGKNRQHAALIMWPCSGQANQKWYLTGNMFQSALSGEKRCIDLADNRRDLELYQCWSPSEDQRFIAMNSDGSLEFTLNTASVTYQDDREDIVQPDLSTAPAEIRKELGLAP